MPRIQLGFSEISPWKAKKFLFSGLYKTREERTGIKLFLMVLAKGKRPKFTI
jgi:hypothetical protein